MSFTPVRAAGAAEAPASTSAGDAQHSTDADLERIREAAERLAATSRRLAEAGGAAYARSALDAIRRSCASRGVQRLDELAPSAIESSARDADEKPLFELDWMRAAADTIERVERDSSYAIAPGGGIELRRGQIRTKLPVSIARNDAGTIEIAVRTSEPGQMLIGWSDKADAPRLRRNNARIDLVGDGRTHVYEIDGASALARGLSAGASVRRFFFATKSGAPIVLERFRVLPRDARHAGGAWRTSHEDVAGELRSVLAMRPPTMLAWDLDVPKERPLFETGLALLGDGDAVAEMEIAVAADAGRKVPLKRLVRPGRWEDAAIDLSDFAGRRVRLSLAVRGSAAAVALWSSPQLRRAGTADDTRPYLVVLEDALRADRLSTYGGHVPSPSHDRIAAGGAVFERAFSQATQTRASVPSMMTSLLPSANGSWDFSDALSERYVTLAEVLRACGFATASFVQNGNAGRYAGLAQGFDVVFDEEKSGARAEDLLARGSPLDRWLVAQKGRPYFAYVHLLDPHGPYDPAVRPPLDDAAAGEELMRDRSIDAEWLVRPTAEARRRLYDAEVAANDRALGGFLDRMESRGDLARAVVAVVADHGEYLGESGLWRHHPPARVEVARVPFLLRAPGAKPSRAAAPVALLDLMPTLLDLAQIDATPLAMHGVSLAGSLRGEAPPARAVPTEEMLLDHGERRARGCGGFATRRALWLRPCTREDDFVPGKLLPERSGGPDALRVFDLDAAHFGIECPPGNARDASATGAALESIQEAGIAAWKAMTEGSGEKILSDPATSERLRALGYTH